jgi:hypothetical protein
MALSARIVPPIVDAPIAADGAHTQSWAEFHQAVADRLVRLPGLLTTGVVDGSDAIAGAIGEYLSSVVAPPGIVLSNSVTANITTLLLTAGDWEVSGNVSFQPDATTHPIQIAAGVSLASAGFGAVRTQIPANFNFPSFLAIGTGGPVRVSVAAPTTVYLVAFTLFTTAGMHASGSIGARRMR